MTEPRCCALATYVLLALVPGNSWFAVCVFWALPCQGSDRAVALWSCSNLVNAMCCNAVHNTTWNQGREVWGGASLKILQCIESNRMMLSILRGQLDAVLSDHSVKLGSASHAPGMCVGKLLETAHGLTYRQWHLYDQLPLFNRFRCYQANPVVCCSSSDFVQPGATHFC